MKYHIENALTVNVVDEIFVPYKDPDQLKAAIAKQPVSVLVDAGSSEFYTYESGVLDGPSCGSYVNHAVLAVGYGIEDGLEYYLVKNSWGPYWGDNGYIKISITPGFGTCAIQFGPSYPITDDK